MKKFLLIIAFIAVGFVMQAQTVAEIEETVARFNNPSTPCNQGGEAFNDFIAKFSTDQKFLNSRLKLTEAQKSEYAE